MRPKSCRLARHAELRWRVAQKLALQWSPEQVSGWLKRQFPADQGMQISHETIYRSLFIQTRGVLKKQLMAHLRTARQMRQAKAGTTKSGLGQIVDTVSIRERPADADDRAVPGHWEGDLLCGANNTHIVTLVERHTRFVMLLKVPSKDTATVVAALGKHVSKLPQQLCRSLTWDRGKEMADHKNFTIATKIQVYFCDPRSPWQRGTNENTNGLLRQYFPRGTDLSRFSQAHLNRIALRLNQRPRRPWALKHPPINYEQCCIDRLNPLLKPGIGSRGWHVRKVQMANRTAQIAIACSAPGRSGSRATPTHAPLTDWMSNFTKPLLAVDAEIVGNDAAATAERQPCPASVQH